MEQTVIENKMEDAPFILRKLTNTVASYKSKYPELGYITSGIELVKQDSKTDNTLDLLERLNQYMKYMLTNYYVIKVIQNKFEREIEEIKEGTPVNQAKDLYLEFAGFKEKTPIK